MPTSVHIPKPLLDKIDDQAKRLQLSRNRFIVHVLTKELSKESTWSSGFFEAFRNISIEDKKAVDEMHETIMRRRTRKRPIDL